MDFGVIYQFVLGERIEPLSIGTQAAIDSAAAAASAAEATWWSVRISVIALFLTGLAAIFTGFSLTAWRNQTVGEKEFNSLIETYQILRDIKAEIYNIRLTTILEGQAGNDERSRNFRQQLSLLNSSLLGKTVGLDLVWGKEFKKIREDVEKEINSLARASRMIYETNAQGILPQHHHAMNRFAPREVSHPYMLQGPVVINPEEQEIAKKEIMARSDAKFDALEEWIAKRLSRYIPNNKKHQL